MDDWNAEVWKGNETKWIKGLYTLGKQNAYE